MGPGLPVPHPEADEGGSPYPQPASRFLPAVTRPFSIDICVGLIPPSVPPIFTHDPEHPVAASRVRRLVSDSLPGVGNNAKKKWVAGSRLTLTNSFMPPNLSRHE